MRISIVIPAYNASRFLANTVASVVGQTFTNWECVIVDDGSRDDTFAVAQGLAKDDPRIRVVQQENGGIANARNRGFCETSPATEFVIFLDHDDRWEPDCLEVLLVALTADPKATAAHGLALAIDMDPQTISVVEPHVKHRHRKIPTVNGTKQANQTEPTTHHMLIWDNCITTTGLILMRRTALNKAGLFDKTIEPLDDWDMYFRLAMLSHLVFVDKVVIQWRLHASNTSNNKQLMNEATCAIRQKMLARRDLRSEDFDCIRKRFRRMFRSEYRHDAIDMVAYSRECLASGRAGQGATYIAEAVKKYAAYLWLHIRWDDSLYGKPVPVRFADRMKQAVDSSSQ